MAKPPKTTAKSTPSDPEAFAILQALRKAKSRFAAKSRLEAKKHTKFTGAVTIEIIREHLKAHGFSVSPRDVFIKGIPLEIDLLIVKPKTVPEHGILYHPDDVLAALEIKARGCYGEKARDRVGESFQRLSRAGHIWCAYLTVVEQEHYKWSVTTESIGFPAYTMFCHKGDPDDLRAENATADWKKFLRKLTAMTGQRHKA